MELSLTDAMDMTDIEDGPELYRRLRNGEEKAYACLFSSCYRDLYNYAGRIVHDPDLAHNIVQELFCHLFENRARLDFRTSVRSYLYRSVYNRCLDALKYENVRKVYKDKVILDFYSREVALDPEVEMNLHREEIRKAVREAIDRLPERCRQIFVLSKIEEKSNQEIADELGISVKTVESQMRIAFSRLRKELGWIYYLVFIAFFSRFL